MALKYLPKNYLRIASLDLAEDRKTARRINLSELVAAVVMTAAARLFVPFSVSFDIEMVTRNDVARAAALIPALLLYSLIHTLIRYLLLKNTGKVKPGTGVSRLTPWVSSGAYMNKTEFSKVTLLPTAVIALVYMALNLVLPIRWFWYVYIMQIINVTGAAGDVHAVWYAKRFGEDVLIHDGGTFTEYYIKAETAGK